MCRSLLFFSVGAFPALLAACGLGTDSTDRAPQIEELALLSYMEEIRIGSLDDPDEGFSRIGTVVMADDGTLYVLESQDREVRVFGPNGERLGTRGRPGQGPGEFMLTRPDGVGSFYGVSDADFAAAMASGLKLPGHRPPLRSTRVGADGSVWIELDGPSPERADWVVLDPDLTPRGRVALPPRMTPRYIDGSIVWMVELDELHVPWSVRLHVE